MKVVCVGEASGLWRTIALILRVRWPDLTMLQATEAREGIELIYREEPDTIIVHWDPATTLDCFDFISEVRSFSDIPLIVVSRSNDATDKVRALEMGADDWVTPSTLPMEFIAEVNAILRRCSPRDKELTSSFLDGKLTINYATREVFVYGKAVKLIPIEYKIVCQLVKSEGSVVSRSTLLHSGWGPDYRAAPEFLKKYIHRLRFKMERDPAHPQLIVTERGVGYRLARPGGAPE